MEHIGLDKGRFIFIQNFLVHYLLLLLISEFTGNISS